MPTTVALARITRCFPHLPAHSISSLDLAASDDCYLGITTAINLIAHRQPLPSRSCTTPPSDSLSDIAISRIQAIADHTSLFYNQPHSTIMSVKVNLTADIPLELFSAIRHGGLDDLKPHELGHISSIATQALIEGSKTTLPISPPPADFTVILKRLKERVKPVVEDLEPTDSRSLHDRMYDGTEGWPFEDEGATYEKLRCLQAHCEVLISEGTFTAELGLQYMIGEINARKLFTSKKTTALCIPQQDIPSLLHRGTEFRHRMSCFFGQQLRRAVEKARIETRDRANKHEDDDVYSIIKYVSNNPGRRRAGPIFESLNDAKDVALLMLLEYTMMMYNAQFAGHLLADQVLDFGVSSADGIALMCEDSSTVFIVSRHTREYTGYPLRRRGVVNIGDVQDTWAKE